MTLDDFPLDSDGNPLAWPDPNQPEWYVDAWNGIYDSRDFALNESRGWVADETERTLSYGAAPAYDDPTASDARPDPRTHPEFWTE